MNGLELYEKVRAVPDEAKKEIKGGRMNGKTDINPMWRIKTLTEQFGPCGIGWYYIPVKKWLEQSGNEAAAFVDIEMYVKVDGEWSKPISGTGGSAFVSKEKSGLYVSDECYKMATTDAISVACKQLGIGADVYWGADRTKYDGKADDSLITEKMKKTFQSECERIGKPEKAILKVLNVKSLETMTQGEYKVALVKFAKTPDKPKEIDSSMIPPEKPEGVPWKT